MEKGAAVARSSFLALSAGRGAMASARRPCCYPHGARSSWRMVPLAAVPLCVHAGADPVDYSRAIGRQVVGRGVMAMGPLWGGGGLAGGSRAGVAS